MDNGLWLVICGMAADSRSFRIGDGTYLIGRTEGCDIRLVHESVSRQHAILVNDSGTLLIRDLGSQNGTFVDGRPVQSATIQVGSSLRIGAVTLDVVNHSCKSGGLADDEPTPRSPVRNAEDACLRAAGFGPVRTQVLSLLLDGLSEKQIAARLEISEQTVHWHKREMYESLDVHTRAELTAHFRNRDTIPAALSTVRSVSAVHA